jgi:hypothetical protein
VRKRIGEFLVEKGVINEAQVQEILKYGQRTGLRFGEAGLELKILSREMLIQVFGPSFNVDFFHLNPEYFPQVTRDLFTVDQIIEWGALPLGFKTEHKFFRARKMLNVGFLDPARADAVQAAEAAARAKLGANGIHGLKVFLILTDQFLEVMRGVYRVDEAALRARDHTSMDGTLAMFLEHVPAAAPKAEGAA